MYSALITIFTAKRGQLIFFNVTIYACVNVWYLVCAHKTKPAEMDLGASQPQASLCTLKVLLILAGRALAEKYFRCMVFQLGKKHPAGFTTLTGLRKLLAGQQNRCMERAG